MGLWQKIKDDFTVVSTTIISEGVGQSKSTMFGGAYYGTTTFLVTYASGRRTPKTVKTGSLEYKNLLVYLNK